MLNNIICLVFIVAIPLSSFVVYYITGLLAVISGLNSAIIALEKKCAVIEVAKQASENTAGILHSQLKIAEITNVSTSSNLNTYLIVGSVFMVVCFCAYFNMSSATLAKEIAEKSVEHGSQNAQKITEIISHDVVTALVEPSGTLITCFSNQEKQISVVNNLLSTGLRHNLESLSCKLDSLSDKSSSILSLLNKLVPEDTILSMPDLYTVGVGADILTPLSSNMG
jgi:hypothetical protein